MRGRSANDAAIREERLTSGRTIERTVAPPAAAGKVDNAAPSRSDESPLCEAPEQLPGESTAAYFTRLRAMILHGRVVDEDSTEIIRRAREERSAQLARLSEQ